MRPSLLALALLLAFLPALPGGARADAPPPRSPPQKPGDAFAGRNRMNGYSLGDYPNFASTWNFVTVRYRKDSGEMRMIYANDIAWKTMRAGRIDYPDGAAFAKIAIMTRDDPGFTSSLVPSGAERYQLMVMDHKKNAATKGWGYALFDQSGKTFPGNPADMTAACHACHLLVPDRGYVFAQPINIGLNFPIGMRLKNAGDASGAGDADTAGRLHFETVGAGTLPALVKKQLPPGVTQVRRLRGPMEKALFHGTIDEIRPSLGRESVQAGMPALLLSEDRRQFSMVLKNPDRKACGASQDKPETPMLAVFTDIVRERPQNLFVRTMPFCESAPGK
jgi:hypothetical protein